MAWKFTGNYASWMCDRRHEKSACWINEMRNMLAARALLYTMPTMHILYLSLSHAFHWASERTQTVVIAVVAVTMLLPHHHHSHCHHHHHQHIRANFNAVNRHNSSTLKSNTRARTKFSFRNSNYENPRSCALSIRRLCCYARYISLDANGNVERRREKHISPDVRKVEYARWG